MVKAGGVTTTEPFLTRQELADRLQLCVTTVDAMVAPIRGAGAPAGSCSLRYWLGIRLATRCAALTATPMIASLCGGSRTLTKLVQLLHIRKDMA